MEPSEPAFAEPLHVGRPNIGDRGQFLADVEAALDRRWLTNDGPFVRELETRIARLLGVRHCVATANGTVALEIAIRALGLSGEVIVPSFTFVATAHALQWQGITPVFVDIDPVTHCLDPDAVRRAITPNTSGIIAVHLWGRGAPARELQAIADEFGLQLMFDAAHAFGASIGPDMIGTFGRAEVLSFHATKFFNTLEGGAIVTNDDDVAAQARLMRNFGFAGDDNVISVGTNGKMNEICAAMGLANLASLDEVIAANRENYEAYSTELSGVEGVSLLPMGQSGTSNFQYVVMLIDDTAAVTRDHVVATLRRNNVLARRYFWPGCHRMEPYITLYPTAGDQLPYTERVAEQVIVLPTGTAVNRDDIHVIARLVRDVATRV